MPVSPAIDASSFRAIEAPSRLWIPYTGRALAPQTMVRAGAALVDPPDGAMHVALAPVASTVIESGRAVLVGGRSVDALLLEPTSSDGELNDVPGDAESIPFLPGAVAEWLKQLPPDAMGAQIDRLRHCGVWADRWTSPDLLGQLHQSLRRPIDTIVCTVLDADPSLPVNRVCCEERGTEVVAAVAALGKLTNAERLWIVVDERAPASTWIAMRDAVGVGGPEMRIVPLENDYPQADPTLLTYTLTRRRLRPGRLPTEQGVLLFDAAAAVAMARAMVRNEPMLRVPLAVYEQAHDRSHLLSIPVGTRLGDVLASLQLPRHGLDLRAGGPLREVRATWDHVIAGSELGVYAIAREPDINPDPCVRCGWCIEGCPVRIHPAGILQAAQQQDHALAERFGLAACIECGICSYVCPSHLPLLHGVRVLRGEAAHPEPDDEPDADAEE